MVILIQTTEETRLTEDRIWGPFIIMIGFMAGRAYTFQTGGCLNPGIALGLEIFESMRYNDAGRMKYLWLYILAPILGGLLALWFFSKLYLPYYLQKKQNKVNLFSYNKKEKRKETRKKETIVDMPMETSTNMGDISPPRNIQRFAFNSKKRRSKSISRINFNMEESKNEEIRIEMETNEI